MGILFNLYSELSSTKEERMKSIVKTYMDEISSYTEDYDGLCRVFANNIMLDLNKRNIDSKIINLLDLGVDLDHEFIMSNFDDKIYLIDPSFRQFCDSGRGLSNKFVDYPGNVLEKDENGLLVKRSLLDTGVLYVENDEFDIYVNSFVEALGNKNDLSEERRK